MYREKNLTETGKDWWAGSVGGTWQTHSWQPNIYQLEHVQKCHLSFPEIFQPTSHRRFATQALQSSVPGFSQSTMPFVEEETFPLPPSSQQERHRLTDGKGCSKTTQLQCNTFFCFIHRNKCKIIALACQINLVWPTQRKQNSRGFLW